MRFQSILLVALIGSISSLGSAQEANLSKLRAYCGGTLVDHIADVTISDPIGFRNAVPGQEGGKIIDVSGSDASKKTSLLQSPNFEVVAFPDSNSGTFIILLKELKGSIIDTFSVGMPAPNLRFSHRGAHEELSVSCEFVGATE